MNTDKIYAEKIASEFALKETRKIIALKKLVKLAKRKAYIFSLTFGIICTLILGTGMCFSMKVIGNNSLESMILGIILGVIGMVGISINYFIYKKLIQDGKKKYGNDIIQLAKEISEE